jgi:hypothetical protein
LVFLGAACGDGGAETDEALDIGEGDELGADLVFGGAIMIISECNAERGGAVPVKLISGGLAGAAGHEAALDGDVGLGGNLAESECGGGIEDVGFVADAEDGAFADFCGRALGAGLDGDNGEIVGDEAGGGEFYGSDETDLLGAREEGEARAFGLGLLELDESGDDDRAADEIVAGAGVDQAVAELELRQVPHGEAAIAADAGILEPRLRDAAEELHGMFVAGEMMDVAEGLPIGADPAGMIHVRGKGVAGPHGFAAGALVAGDEVAVLIGLDGNVRQLFKVSADGLGDGFLVKRGGGPGDDVPKDGEEGPPVHGAIVTPGRCGWARKKCWRWRDLEV